MITVFFVDDGQDFLEWDVNDKGEVVECRPFQGDVWVGTKILDKEFGPGAYLNITTTDGAYRRLIHAVEKVLELA